MLGPTNTQTHGSIAAQTQTHTQTHVQMGLTEALTGEHTHTVPGTKQIPEHSSDPPQIFQHKLRTNTHILRNAKLYPEVHLNNVSKGVPGP